MHHLATKMASSSTKKGKAKPSQITIQITGKGSKAYKDIDWKTLSDGEAKAIEKEASLAWNVLSNTQVQTLQELPIEDVETKLAVILKLTNSNIELYESVLLDYYVCGFWWAKEQGFTSQQLSGFFTVLHVLLENIKEKHLSLSDNISMFHKMLVGIGHDNTTPCGGLDFFDVEHAKIITDYLKSTLFQHHGMYEALFHSKRKEDIVGSKLVVEVLPLATLPFPPPLDEGLSEAVFIKHLAPTASTIPSLEPQTSNHEQTIRSDETSLGLDQDTEVKETCSDEKIDLLSDVTADEVKVMFDSISKELFAGLKTEISEKLLERETTILARINRIHRITDT